MWKELQKSPAYFLLTDQRQIYSIFVTDYIRIWGAYFTENEFIACLKESNFGLEMEKNELLDKGYQMLQKPSELKNIKISIDGPLLTVSMSRSFGFLLKFSVKLEEGSREFFFQKVTQPALKIIQDLRCSQQELRKLLITKDDEIEEYKSFGGKIRYTAIPPYNDELHMKKHCLYHANFGDAEVPASVMDRIIDVPPENPIIKEERNETKVSVKLEPASQQTNATSKVNTIYTVKKESIKTEPQTARKRKLNI
ncbi:uncharacterized protein LOC123867618 [Maniola jurtina]|uniref:uncharacterized protein LOC123867618 n=1 Tax=Maniola jurtina TaxID=191418 RepID=UPI001E687179|nr:uncharacterized protein LOC123867618 [Maniola jurtina]